MEYDYIAYIDEAGDPGLNKVRPLDENGASEWLVLGAVVMKAKREELVVDWVKAILTDIGLKQRTDLHYTTLSPTRRVVTARHIAGLPLRGFAVLSNKKNMRGYHNARAAKVPSQQWFYNWCVRLLLERVTAFCAEQSMKEFGELRKIKIEFSKRGGLHYSQTIAYHEYLKIQQQGDKIYLQKRQPVLQMLNHELMLDYPHYMRAGLQLADVIASAFYQAADALGPGSWSVDAALALAPIMARENNMQKNFGVALFPTPAWKGELTPGQQSIFKSYGYGFERW